MAKWNINEAEMMRSKVHVMKVNVQSYFIMTQYEKWKIPLSYGDKWLR